MKILYVTNLYGSLARGGAERIVETEARAMADAGHEVTVLTMKPAGSTLPDAETADGISIRRLVQRNLFFYADAHRHPFLARFAWHLIDIFDRATAEAVGRVVRELRPDAVHTHNLMGVSFLVPAMLRRLRVRHVHTLHDVQLLHPSGLITVSSTPPSWPVRFVRWAHCVLLRTVVGSPTVVLSPSRFLANRHVAAGYFRRSKVLVAPNPVPDALAHAAPREDRKRFLFVGQLERHKGIIDLLDVWEKLGGLEGGTLEIAGDGTLAKEARDLAAVLPGVTVLGHTVGDALLAAYDRAAFVVLPSVVIENAPTVIGEAMSRGVPVVATATGGVPELVQDEANGFLAVPGDAASLEGALLRATRHAAWEMLSGNALAAARQRSMERHREALLGTYVATSRMTC
jgi:glycogen synthase